MAMMEHSARWCNRLGKLAQSQHTSNMTTTNRERGRAESEKARLMKWERESGLVENKEKPLELLAGELVSSAEYQSESAI